jgi:hypothetical protein
MINHLFPIFLRLGHNRRHMSRPREGGEIEGFSKNSTNQLNLPPTRTPT